MSKGSKRRPTDEKVYGDNFDKIFGGSMEELYHVIETDSEIFWSKRKMDTTYKHIEYLWRDRARYKELNSQRWKKLQQTTKKKVYEVIG